MDASAASPAPTAPRPGLRARRGLSYKRGVGKTDKLKEAMPELIGQKLGDYEILSELGRGAMGVVYKARQYSLDRLVALKVLAPELARDTAYIERFKREAIIAATVTHPNVVSVYEAGTHLDLGTGERLHYFAMEYVEGETVQHRLARQDRIPADEVAAIGVRIAEGLESAWKKARIIHRDIKPSNIFLSRDGDVKIGDLGLARIAGDAQASLTATGAIIGTAYYMSPEQARGESNVDFRSDIYSLGCTLYRMLSGKHLYEGAFASIMVKHLTEPPPSLRMIMPDCPVAIVNVIEKMLTKHPNDRQQSYQELIDDLRRAHERIMGGDSEEEVEAETTAPASRWPTALAMAGIAVVVAVAAFLWWTPWGQSRSDVSPGSLATDGQAGRLSHSASQKPAEEKTSPANTATVSKARAKPVAKVATVAVSSATTNPPTAGGTPAHPATPAARTAPVATDPFSKEVATLPPEQQVARVAAKLKELNPGFDGKETHKIENGAVTELALSTVGVADIGPLKALPWLKTLTLAPPTASQKGALSDLSPLKALLLTALYCPNNPISDLSPIRDMPLTTLSVGGTQVNDLSPLTDMKLTVLSFNDTMVSDLSPLAGMPLTVLWCNNTSVTDLSSLLDTPLQEVKCDFVPARDAAILRSIQSLAKINDQTAETFWDRVGKVETPPAVSPPGMKTGMELPPPEIEEDFAFTDTSKPYALKGTFVVKQGGGRKQITVGAGVEIRGGRIYLNKEGELIIAGTPQKPAVLRGVTIGQDLTNFGLKARWVIFDKCRFAKVGGWYSYNSTKWICDYCLFYKCAFTKLTGVDYGFKLTHCAFVSMKFPEIIHSRPKEGKFDHMKSLRKGWNTLANCQFVDAEVPPTVAWCASESNFMGCRFVSGETFESDTPTEVVAFVADTTSSPPDKVWDSNAARAALKVSYTSEPFSTVTFPSLAVPLNNPISILNKDKKLKGWLSSKPAASGTGIVKETAATPEPSGQPETALQADGDFTGTWKIKFDDNTTRTYQIDMRGAVLFVGENRRGQLARGAAGGGLMLDFGDGKVERLRFAGNAVSVEHFAPKTTFPNQPPALLGRGTRDAAATPVESKPPPPAFATAGNQAHQLLITSIGIELVSVPSGEFMLGSTPEEREWATSTDGRRANAAFVQAEGGQPRKTMIQQKFWLGRTEVTVGQWKQFVKATRYVTSGETAGASFAPTGLRTWKHVEGANWRDPHFGPKPKDDDPVCCISWDDAMAFCAWLDKQDKGRLPAGCQIRLPTEAEWEYACRAGAQTKFWWGDAPSDGEGRLNWSLGMKEQGFVTSADHYGARGRNAFGLADMLGNLWEWCLDGYDDRGAHEQQWISKDHLHVIRGGAFGGGPGLPRCALREPRLAIFSSATCGFRVACGVPPVEMSTRTEAKRHR